MIAKKCCQNNKLNAVLDHEFNLWRGSQTRLLIQAMRVTKVVWPWEQRLENELVKNV